MIDEKPPNGFEAVLQEWFRTNGRRLPWRENPSPYAVLVSEFMLQQTTVAAVIPYFQRWMAVFPDLTTLAAAPEPTVLKLWEGLGYYSRARNLHRAAKAVVEKCASQVPSDLSLLQSLPGIGPYTAAAIVAFAFDRPVPVLDANINRVVARLFNFRTPITTSEGRSFLEHAAASLLPPQNGRLHASALMDLGSLVCRAGEPDCEACPLRAFCRATHPATIPLLPPKKKPTPVEECRAFASDGGRVFLLQSHGPRWKGLWTLPLCDPSPFPLVSLTHTITRYKVSLRVFAQKPVAGWQSFPLAHLPPMPSPHRKAIASILAKNT
jgi:A/G-specific adenine glycosylase